MRNHPMKNEFKEDDGRVIADMSDIRRQPLLVPDLDLLRRGRGASQQKPEQDPVSMDGEERRAMIRGALSAAFLVLGVLAAAFAGLIFLIGNVWG